MCMTRVKYAQHFDFARTAWKVFELRDNLLYLPFRQTHVPVRVDHWMDAEPHIRHAAGVARHAYLTGFHTFSSYWEARQYQTMLARHSGPVMVVRSVLIKGMAWWGVQIEEGYRFSAQANLAAVLANTQATRLYGWTAQQMLVLPPGSGV